jgi:hypothetical protein
MGGSVLRSHRFPFPLYVRRVILDILGLDKSFRLRHDTRFYVNCQRIIGDLVGPRLLFGPWQRARKGA